MTTLDGSNRVRPSFCLCAWGDMIVESSQDPRDDGVSEASQLVKAAS